MKKLISFITCLMLIFVIAFVFPVSSGEQVNAETKVSSVNYDMRAITNAKAGNRELVIKTTGVKESDKQVLCFRITGRIDNEYVDFTVEIVGNGEITIKNMHPTTYTVTEIVSDSWRIEPENQEIRANLYLTGKYEVIFDHTRRNNRWLNANGNVEGNK